MCMELADTSACQSSRWVELSATICNCNTTTAIYMCQLITSTPFVNTSVEKLQHSTEWVDLILQGLRPESAVPFVKLHKNLSFSINAELVRLVMLLPATRRGSTKWKQRFHLLKPLTNELQLLIQKVTWSAKCQWIVSFVAMLDSEKQKSLFVQHSNVFKKENK